MPVNGCVCVCVNLHFLIPTNFLYSCIGVRMEVVIVTCNYKKIYINIYKKFGTCSIFQLVLMYFFIISDCVCRFGYSFFFFSCWICNFMCMGCVHWYISNSTSQYNTFKSNQFYYCVLKVNRRFCNLL